MAEVTSHMISGHKLAYDEGRTLPPPFKAPPPPATRICRKCGTEKAINEYGTPIKGSFSRRYECKSCLTARTAKWRAENSYAKHKKDKCEHCPFVASHSCQLDVDHIDGNHKNNDPSNLQTLCANCHRLKTLLNHETRLACR